MKIKNIILPLLVFGSMLSSCYEDKGNYDYVDINEVTIEGIADEYSRDLDDSLIITPKYIGTQYNDTTKFNFRWIVDGREKSTYAELRMIVDMLPGKREARLTITDKKTSVKAFKKFTINVSSSTAGDLYMILSKSKGKAELSYLRLDKPSNFAINYYEERFGAPLGTVPQQLCMIDQKQGGSYLYPFSKNQGRFIALVDNFAYLFDKHNLEMDKATNYLTGETYTGMASYPPADVEGYKTEFATSIVDMWRLLANGAQQEGIQFAEISGGYLYRFNIASNNSSGATRYYKIKPSSSEYPNASLSPFCFWDDIVDAPSEYPWVQGNTLGNMMVFDKVNGRFAFGYSSSIYTIKKEEVKAFPGHDLLWGTDTDNSNLSMAILAEGNNTRMVLLSKTGSGSAAKYTVSGEVITTNTITRATKFYAMKRSANLFYVTGNKIYLYNMLEASLGNLPAEKNVIARLSDYGYDENAVITSICVSRSERTMLLGVSRYGSDSEAMSDEVKGDLVVLNLSQSLGLSLKETHRGVSGIPVDIKVKYQNHYRDGKGRDGQYVDTI